MKIIRRILLGYIVYFVIGASLIFALPKEVSEEYANTSISNSYYSDKDGVDRAIILDNPLESGLARLFIIENAKERLDVAYYSIERGETPNVFIGALFDAADRGVEVNVLLDGIFHGLRASRRSVIYAIANHPNINLKFYEKFNPLIPWTINNRMHDKYIISDNKIAIIGGRNIGDKYFAPEWYGKAITNDRDVVILNFNENKSLNTSAVNQMSDYFSEVWNHDYSKEALLLTKSIFRKNADKRTDSMRKKAALAREMYKEQFEKIPDLYNISLPTRKVSFIHNPIERFSKQPWCWHELLELSKGAKNSVFVQSPYFIPSKKMTKSFANFEDFKSKDVVFLTNSLASTPNPLAFAGYQNYRKKIVDQKIKIIEIQSTDSIHSKAFVIDNEIVAIGSFNVDPRSTFLSTESMVVIHSKEVVEDFRTNIFEYTDRSLSVNENYSYKKDEQIEELIAHPFKKILIMVLSVIVRPFDYLL